MCLGVSNCHKAEDLNQGMSLSQNSGEFSPGWMRGTSQPCICTTVADSARGVLRRQAWVISSGEVAIQLHQKSTTKEAAPYLHFTDDESMVYHLMTNAINGYSMDNPQGGETRGCCGGTLPSRHANAAAMGCP